MMKIAYLIIAHYQPEHLTRLINVLNCKEAYFFIHIDRKSNIFKFKSLIPEEENVIFLENQRRIKVYWGGFSLVKATLNLLHSALENRESFQRYCLLSGSDFPIKKNKFIKQQFSSDQEFISIDRLIKITDDHTYSEKIKFIYFQDIPFLRINKNSGGKYRLSGKIPRKIYSKINLYHGSQWWCLTDQCVQFIVNFLAENEDYIRFHKLSYTADEIFFHSIVKSSPFASKISHDFERESSLDKVFQLNQYGAHYIDWNSKDVELPKVLDESDFEALCQSQALFARKFDQDKSAKLLERLDILI